MRNNRVTITALVAASLAVAGCGQADPSGAPTGEQPSRVLASAPAPSTPSTPTDTAADTNADINAQGGDVTATAEANDSQAGQQLEGCERYADPDLAAQVAEQPVLEVIAQDPQLSWLHSALTGGHSPEVDYADVLVGGPFTVFAPVDDPGRAELDQELREDPVTLRFLLDYHVVPGQSLSAQELVDAAAATDTGTVTTLQGWGLAAFEPLDGSAEVALSEDTVVPLCGEITTADATLYLVPALMHPAGDYVVPGTE